LGADVLRVGDVLLPPAPQGYLLPSYHQFYWMGLTVAEGSTWPSFTWVDHMPGPNATS
jgi:hypothetical protein